MFFMFLNEHNVNNKQCFKNMLRRDYSDAGTKLFLVDKSYVNIDLLSQSGKGQTSVSSIQLHYFLI